MPAIAAKSKDAASRRFSSSVETFQTEMSKAPAAGLPGRRPQQAIPTFRWSPKFDHTNS
jgi:hypothetical protein